MSHTAPDGTPATRGDPGQTLPETLGHCQICGKELAEGMSYIEMATGLICHNKACLVEAVQEADHRIGELQEKLDAAEGKSTRGL